MAHTPLELTRLAAERLEAEGIENARLEAELLLGHVLDLERLELYLQHDRPLTPDEVEGYRVVLRRRLEREPVQYITGRVRFRELELKVDRRALIPRPETEVLAGAVLEWVERWLQRPGTAAEAGPLTALDIGTGSGAIALSLLHEGPFERVVATDTSADALALARENAEALGLSDGLELRSGGLWDAVGSERFRVVVANPPYVADGERDALMPEVRDWEPAEALFAGPDGRALLDAVVRGAPERLLPGGLLALEVGLGQARGVADVVRETRGLAAPRIVEDLTGRERLVMSERATELDP